MMAIFILMGNRQNVGNYLILENRVADDGIISKVRHLATKIFCPGISKKDTRLKNCKS